MLLAEDLVIRDMVDHLPLAKGTHRIKMNAFRLWLPPKVEQFIERVSFFPSICPHPHQLFEQMSSIAVLNEVFKLGLSFIHQCVITCLFFCILQLLLSFDSFQLHQLVFINQRRSSVRL
jgi:hypothetical protein